MNKNAKARNPIRYGLLVGSVLATMMAAIWYNGESAASAISVMPPAVFTSTGTNVLYTTNADFDQGTLVNVNHDAPNINQLQLNTTTGTFPFIWVSMSQRCTIAKISTVDGTILGEYRTIADGAPCNESSRTTVALDGSVWVGHRGPGGVTHVGLKELNQCVDRNMNGTIETSTAYGDVKAWPGATSLVSAAQDECIIHHVDTDSPPVGFSDTRHMSIDKNNKLWVGDYSGGHQFIRVNANTGAVETATRSFDCGGYGGLIDGNGVIWSANGGSNGLLRWNPDAPDDATNPRCINIPVYGLALDPGGNVWVGSIFGNEVRKVSADGNTILGPFAHGSDAAQGLAADSNGDIWVSSSLFCTGVGCTIGHLKNDGTFVGNVPNPTGAGSTGVSIDAAGKPWSANINSNSATRIDPSLGPLGCGGTGCGDGTHVGDVDLTVNFPAGPDGRPLPFPYNYSDMTGSQLLGGTAPQGTWTITQDSGAMGTAWGTVTWNTEPQGMVPPGASITVEARAADTEAGLGSEAYVGVTNGVSFSLTGQFIQVRATLKPGDEDASPVLSDIRIATANQAPDCTLAAASTGSIWPANHQFVPVSIVGVTDPDGDSVTITVNSIFQDEPVKEPSTGNFSPDATGVGTSTANVRAERAGDPKKPGNGRVYTISFTASDGKGGTCQGVVRVCVPRDQNPANASCVDDGPSYDSTIP